VTTHTDNYNYQYNGLGDRVQQTVKGVTTTYVLDLNVGLTQVLNEGTDTYLYGLSRIGEESIAWDYFLGDALGSVRQLVDDGGAVSLAQTYQPYGEVWSRFGDGISNYSYTGEQLDTSGLIYLRARYMDSSAGRFITRDTWMGDYNQPMSLNRWMYTLGNPVNYTDPSGHIPESDWEAATNLYKFLLSTYNVRIERDWGIIFTEPRNSLADAIYNHPNLDPSLYGSSCYRWQEGDWRSLHELELVRDAVMIAAQVMGGAEKFKSAMHYRPIEISREVHAKHIWTLLFSPERDDPLTLPPVLEYFFGDILLPDKHFNRSSDDAVLYWTIHEIGHVWDTREGFFGLSVGLQQSVGTISNPLSYEACLNQLFTVDIVCGLLHYDYDAGIEIAPGRKEDPYASTTIFEDFAESFASYVYPPYYVGLGDKYSLGGPIRRQFIIDRINQIN